LRNRKLQLARVGLVDQYALHATGQAVLLDRQCDTGFELQLRGESGVVVTISGMHLDGGNESASFGAGVTVVSGPTPNVGGTSASVTLNVAANAAFGARDVTYTTFGGSVVSTGAFGVIGAPPTVTSVTPTNAAIPGAGSSPTNITVTGTNFLTGDTVTLEAHAGVTVTGVVVVNSTTITATVNVTNSATVERLDVNVVQSAGNGGATVSLIDGLKIGVPDPIVTAMEPDHGRPS
jgi:hypothetical protein